MFLHVNGGSLDISDSYTYLVESKIVSRSEYQAAFQGRSSAARVAMAREVNDSSAAVHMFNQSTSKLPFGVRLLRYSTIWHRINHIEPGHSPQPLEFFVDIIETSMPVRIDHGQSTSASQGKVYWSGVASAYLSDCESEPYKAVRCLYC